ncbi:unnamed protein product [Linum trigynum]|uniref:Uncharacterized protein n=1 Tax=Linum trigynum TaxID=586398 RepID=A0AAV2CI46_9ROSI
MLYGFGYAGPLAHLLQKLLDTIFIFQGARKIRKPSARRCLLEQLIVSPWKNMIFMLYYGLVMEGLQPFS